MVSGTRDNPPHELLWARYLFTVLLKTSNDYLYQCPELSRGSRQLGWASCLTLVGRVTLANGTTFLHINALARLTGTTLGVASVT